MNFMSELWDEYHPPKIFLLMIFSDNEITFHLIREYLGFNQIVAQ